MIGVAIVVFSGGVLTVKAQKNRRPKADIEGTWTVESVELAGQPVDGLKGARLVLSTGGKKLFTLLGGTVEKGTYSIDAAKNPPQIDATTEGKPGTQRGIFAVEGDTLKMCLATTGARPANFATKEGSNLLLIVLKRAAGEAAAAPSKSDIPPGRPSGRRSFRMGFTGFVYDTTPQAVAASRKLVRENGDIIDELWKKIESSSPELFKAWRDCGLVDENGKPRPALHVWKDYFELPPAGH